MPKKSSYNMLYDSLTSEELVIIKKMLTDEVSALKVALYIQNNLKKCLEVSEEALRKQLQRYSQQYKEEAAVKKFVEEEIEYKNTRRLMEFCLAKTCERLSYSVAKEKALGTKDDQTAIELERCFSMAERITKLDVSCFSQTGGYTPDLIAAQVNAYLENSK